MEKSESEREIRPRYKTHNPITPLLFSLLETDLKLDLARTARSYVGLHT